jgi:ATP-binding protein involved in chromosome partitioning
VSPSRFSNVIKDYRLLCKTCTIKESKLSKCATNSSTTLAGSFIGMTGRRVPPPTPAEVTNLLRAVIDPELGDNIVDLGMATGVTVSEEGLVTIGVKLTIKGCPLRVQIKNDVESRVTTHPGVTKVKIEWGEMDSDERTAVMTRARWNAKENAPATQIPLNTRILAIASGKGGVGKSSVTVNLAAALANQGHTVGVLDADIWGFSVPRMLNMSDRLEAKLFDGSDKPRMIPNERIVGKGLLKVVSTGMLVEDESTALMWRGLMLTKAVEQFLKDVHWGDLDYLLIDMPPGTGDVQMGLARMLPRADLIIVTTPAVSAQKVAIRAADMARRSFLRIAGVIENMSAFTCEHGTSYPLFGSGGGQNLASEIGSELLGQIPIESVVSHGSDNGEPVAISGSGFAAEAFRDIAQKIIAQTVPVSEMAGCSARLLESVALALGDKPKK